MQQVEWSRLALSRDLKDLFESEKYQAKKRELRHKLEDENGPIAEQNIGFIRGYLKAMKDIEQMAPSMATAVAKVQEPTAMSRHLDTMRRTIAFRRA